MRWAVTVPGKRYIDVIKALRSRGIHCTGRLGLRLSHPLRRRRSPRGLNPLGRDHPAWRSHPIADHKYHPSAPYHTHTHMSQPKRNVAIMSPSTVRRRSVRFKRPTAKVMAEPGTTVPGHAKRVAFCSSPGARKWPSAGDVSAEDAKPSLPEMPEFSGSSSQQCSHGISPSLYGLTISSGKTKNA